MKFSLSCRWCIFNIFFGLLIVGCINALKPCDSANFNTCAYIQTRWQKAINAVVAANFPADYGKYQAVIWENPFDNAWVTKGREVNITRQFVSKLGQSNLICVAAHELAHLKMGHYYSKVGIIIVNPEVNPSPRLKDRRGHYGTSKNWAVPEGFGKNQEKEADRLALEFIGRLGLPPKIYLELLSLFLKTVTHSESQSSMIDRIRFLRSQEPLFFLSIK